MKSFVLHVDALTTVTWRIWYLGHLDLVEGACQGQWSYSSCVEGSLMHQTSRSNPPAMPVLSPTDNNFSLNKIWMKTKEEKTTSRLGPGGGVGKMRTWQGGRQGIFFHLGSVFEDIAKWWRRLVLYYTSIFHGKKYHPFHWGLREPLVPVDPVIVPLFIVVIRVFDPETTCL